ncbi:MAG: hypothetical protein B6I20_06980 [Bacteroidetes bacterium 4572_117]|nr:MAG: hypothetical protein B6I20_06980 [Bacteroidetes bacterium 4572_117]
MLITKHIPKSYLKNYIDHIAFHKSTGDVENSVISVIPDGMTELVLDFENIYKREVLINQTVNITKGSQIIGIKSQPHLLSFSKISPSISVRFKPGCLSFFTSVSMKEIKDKSLKCSDVFGTQIQNLANKVNKSVNSPKMIKHVESFLENAFINDIAVYETRNYICEIYKNPKETKLSKAIISNRNYKKIERRFIKNVGITPKIFSRIVRLNYALSLLKNGKKKSLTHIAFDAGYYDQAHFIKDFYCFTKSKPSKFLSDKTFIENFNFDVICKQFKIK